jgi:hypothetical protein
MIIEPKRVLFVPDWIERTLLNNGKALPDILNFDMMDTTLSQEDLIGLFLINDIKHGYTQVWLGGDASPIVSDYRTLPCFRDANALTLNPISAHEDDGMMSLYSRTQYGTQAYEFRTQIVQHSTWIKSVLDKRLYNQLEITDPATEDLLSDDEVFFKFIDLDTHVLAVVLRADVYYSGDGMSERNAPRARALRTALLKRLCDYQSLEHVARRPLFRDHLLQINLSLPAAL